MNKQARQGAPQSGAQNSPAPTAGVITMHQPALHNSHAKKAAAVIA